MAVLISQETSGDVNTDLTLLIMSPKKQLLVRYSALYFEFPNSTQSHTHKKKIWGLVLFDFSLQCSS